MNKQEYIKLINENFSGSSKDIMLQQLENYFHAKQNYKTTKCKYNICEEVNFNKGTLLHGTSLDGLKQIVNNGLIASIFTDSRTSKYPGCVSVWNLKEDISLKDYIIKYSGATLKINYLDGTKTTQIIPYGKIDKTIENMKNKDYWMWTCEQTKEVRFMPNLSHDNLLVGIIFDSNNKYIDNIKKMDILDTELSDVDVKEFVNEKYYDLFIKDRLQKDDFFTDRESSIIFGIPSNFIEGVIVNKTYENDNNILNEIKKLLPNCYICNLDGIVIK